MASFCLNAGREADLKYPLYVGIVKAADGQPEAGYLHRLSFAWRLRSCANSEVDISIPPHEVSECLPAFKHVLVSLLCGCENRLFDKEKD